MVRFQISSVKNIFGGRFLYFCISAIYCFTCSLINQFLIAVGRINSKRFQSTFLYKVNIKAKAFLQFPPHTSVGKQTNGRTMVKFNENVHITSWCFLSSRIRAKQPSLQNRLRLEIIGEELCQGLGTHVS